MLPVKKSDKFIAYNGFDASFSNFFNSQFNAPLITDKNEVRVFSSVEQYFTAMKALLFNDSESYNQAMQTINGSQLKRIGRGVKNFDANRWNQVKDSVLYDAIYAKFSQNSNLLSELLNSKSQWLVEGNKYDNNYGSGIDTNSMTDSNYLNGNNIQGRILMDVRHRLLVETDGYTIDNEFYEPYLNIEGETLTNREISGDLSKTKSGIIFQQVNCAGVMGAGLAKSLRDMDERVYTSYVDKYNSTEGSSDDYMSNYRRSVKMNLLGQLQSVKLRDDLYVVNSFSQDNLGRNGHFTHEDLLINNLIKANEVSKKVGLPLLVPDKVGAGLGGGDWNKIKSAIDSLDNAYLVKFEKDKVIDLSVDKKKDVDNLPDYKFKNSKIADNFNVVVQNNKPLAREPYSIFLTGHRPTSQGMDRNGVTVNNPNNVGWQNGVATFNLNDSENWRRVQTDMMNYIMQQIMEHKTVEIHSGGALGADLAWGLAALNVKNYIRNNLKRDPDNYIRLVMDIPYEGMEDGWGVQYVDKERTQPKLDNHGNVVRSKSGQFNYDLLQALKNQADVVVIGNTPATELKNHAYVLQQRNENMMNQADECVAFIADGPWELASQKQSTGGTSNAVISAMDSGMPVHRIRPEDYGFEYVMNKDAHDYGYSQDNDPYANNSSSSQDTYRGKFDEPEVLKDSINNTERVEYVMNPGTGHHSYVVDPEATKQNRYWWRDSTVAEYSPVTVNELMRALETAIPNSGRRNDIRRILDTSMSASVYVDSENPKVKGTRKIVSVSKDGLNYDLSPSDVETIVTVMTLVHDAGLDYSVSAGKDGTVELVLNDNNHARICLINPKEPQFVGSIDMRDGTSWATRLGQIIYKNEGSDVEHAIGPSFNFYGYGNQTPQFMEATPRFMAKPKGNGVSTPMFRNYRKAVSEFSSFNNPDGVVGPNNVSYQDYATNAMQRFARARYAGLDQSSKNKIAVVNAVEALGINPKMLSKKMQAYVYNSRYEMRRMDASTEHGYAGLVNLGDGHKGDISTVYELSDSGSGKGSFAVQTLDKNSHFMNGGNIILNLSNVSSVDNDFQFRGTNPVVSPYQMTVDEANQMIGEGYVQARINFLDEMMSEDQSNLDSDLGRLQKRFKHALGNEVVVPTLNEDDEYDNRVVMKRMDGMDIESQRIVLNAIKDGLMNSSYKDGQFIDGLYHEYKAYMDDTSGKGHVFTPREEQAYRDLVSIIHDEFGTLDDMYSLERYGMNRNGEFINVGDSLSLSEYKTRLVHMLDGLSDDDKAKQMESIDAKFKEFDKLVDDTFGEMSDSQRDTLYSLPVHDLKKVYTNYLKRQDLPEDSKMSDLINSLHENHPLVGSLNVTKIIHETVGDSNSNMYEFKMAKALGMSKYADRLRGNNDYDTNRVMERAVVFDSTSAMSIDQLRDADKTGDEAELQQYVKDVRNGVKEFSWDPNENPNPKYFKGDGSGQLIREMSPNEFKARALEKVRDRLVKRGADPKSISVLIDEHGVVQFKAEIPYYDPVTHELTRTGHDFQRDATGNIVKSKRGNAYYDKDVPDNHVRTVPISGTFGQIFAPDHDGVIRTTYNRFDGFDQEAGQQEFLPRYRAHYLLPDRDDSGNWSKEQFVAESKTGLGHMPRLRVRGYDQEFDRQLNQTLDNMVMIHAVGDVTRPNSNTIMNKLMHGSVLGESMPKGLSEAEITPERQAMLETRLMTIRFDDSVGQATKATEMISFMENYQTTYLKLKSEGKDPDRFDVLVAMHSGLSAYGNESIAELATIANSAYTSDNATGQGMQNGPTRTLQTGTVVLDDGRVIPNVFKDKDGNYMKDENGEYVSFLMGSPIERLAFFKYGYMNPTDRQPVGKEQAIKGHAILEGVGVAHMAIGALTMEDGMVISKEFAEKHGYKDDNGNYRPLRPGDKISDAAGNKATVSFVIDPDMDFDEAEKHGLADVVELFKQNPDLEVVMNGMSQMSRNNGSTAYQFLDNESSEPMGFRRKVRDENGNIVDGEWVQTNATINHGGLIITDKTVDHAVTLYDGNNPNEGRKSGGLGLISDASKGAYKVASYFRDYKNGIVTWRRHLLEAGFDLNAEKGLIPANYDALVQSGEAKKFEYVISDENKKLLNSAVENLRSEPITADKRLGKTIANSAVNKDKASKLQFNGVTGDGELTKDSQQFLNTLSHFFVTKNPTVAKNDDVRQQDMYNAGRDFLNQLPDGGVLQLPEGVTWNSHVGPDSAELDKIYILPRSMRDDTKALDNTSIRSNTNRLYTELGTKLAQYTQLRDIVLSYDLAGGNPDVQAKIDKQLCNYLGLQDTFNRIKQDGAKYAFGSPKAKTSEFNTEVLAGKVKDSVTTQVSNNPMLPLDTIEVSPKMAKKLGLVVGDDGYCYIQDKKGDHKDWNYLHVHRDPLWREQGSLAFRVKVNENIDNARVNPVVASLMDLDFDGDNIGLIAMKGDDVQKELRELCTVDRWMLDNNGMYDLEKASNMLNINAELVDMAVNTNNTFDVELRNGEVVSGNFMDKSFREQVLSGVRDDVRPDSWQKQLESGSFTDSDFLNVLVNNAIKTNYEKGEFTKARQDVDAIIQRSRGFDASLDKNGELQIKQGKVSMLASDGVDYTDQDTMRKSLKKYVDEGAKGSDSAIDGLFEYMNKPTFDELVELGQSQVNEDGTLNKENRKKYLETMGKLYESMRATQRANKFKADMTGVPGTIQKKITGVLMNEDDFKLHVANAIGQAGTQKILSIKREPIVAGKISEVLQQPIGQLLRGKYPTTSPKFSLVGRLGENMVDTSERLAKMRELPEFAEGRSPVTFTKDELVNVADKLNYDLNPDNQKEVDFFKLTLQDACEPYVPESIVPRQLDPDEPLRKEHFVEAMNYLYNDVMGLGVNKEMFEALGNALADKNGNIQSVDDVLDAKGSGSFTAKLKQNGISVAVDGALYNEDDKAEVSNPFGSEDSYIRKSLFNGMTNDDLTNVMSLSKRELDVDSKSKDKESEHDIYLRKQDDLLSEVQDVMHSELAYNSLSDDTKALVESEKSLEETQASFDKFFEDLGDSEPSYEFSNNVTDDYVNGLVNSEPQEPVQPVQNESVNTYSTSEPVNLAPVNNQSETLNQKDVDIVMGSYEAPFEVDVLNKTKQCDSVNQFVGYKYLEKALNDDSMNIGDSMAQVLENQLDNSKSTADVAKSISALNEVCQDGMYTTHDDNVAFYAQGYAEQAKSNADVESSLQKVDKIELSDDNPVATNVRRKKKAVKQALNTLDSQKVQATTNKSASVSAGLEL